MVLAFMAQATAAHADNLGENYAWQFNTQTDRANRALIEDMRLKRANGGYAAPVYNTYIDRQYNCSVSSQATGNQGTSTAVGNSPSTSGHSTTSTGNTDTSHVDQGLGDQSSSITASQANSGEVESGSSGEVETSVRGDTFQALNTTQTNSGNQTAGVSSSYACDFSVQN